MACIELITLIVAPRERCFDLARSVDLHLHSTVATGETAIGGCTSGLLALRDEVTWRARHLGVWLTLTSRITAFARPEHFRDSMVSGPLARLDHDHFFSADGPEVTVMRDVFDYAAPGGPLGRLAEILFLTRHFRCFLEVRNRELKAVAESGDWRRFLPQPETS